MRVRGDGQGPKSDQGRKEFSTFSQSGGKHPSLVTHFNCPVYLITGNALAQGGVWRGVCGEGQERRRQLAFFPEPHLPGAAFHTTKCSSSQQSPQQPLFPFHTPSVALSFLVASTLNSVHLREVTLFPKEKKGTPGGFRNSGEGRRGGEGPEDCFQEGKQQGL